MENGYENFVDTLRQSLLKETSYEEEMICYKKAEEYPPTSGDSRGISAYRWRPPAFEESAAGGCV